MPTSRRDLLGQMAGLLVGATLGRTLAGCGDDDGSSPPVDAGPDGGTPDSGPLPDGGFACDAPATNIVGNHGHVMTVSMADVDAGVMKIYDISGSSGHFHEVTLTPTHFATLQAAGAIMVTSTGGPHDHDVMVTCAS